jgi:chromatin remodeling complex protein RSC6
MTDQAAARKNNEETTSTTTSGNNTTDHAEEGSSPPQDETRGSNSGNENSSDVPVMSNNIEPVTMPMMTMSSQEDDIVGMEEWIRREAMLQIEAAWAAQRGLMKTYIAKAKEENCATSTTEGQKD